MTAVGSPRRDETSPLLGNRENGLIQRNVENGEDPSSLPSEEDKPKVNLALLIPAVGIGIFLLSVDQLFTIASYAKIGNDLNALNNTSWIATSYFLTLTSFQPLYGKLSDIFGRKQCLLFSYIIFGLGCLLCGLAQDIVQLCAARAFAGIGGGGMNAVVAILLSDVVPLKDRGVYQGYLNIIGCTGTAVGAPLGGLLADTVGWRWSFIAQAPLCAVAWVTVYNVLDLPPVAHSEWLARVRKIDFLGALTLISAVISLLVGLDCGSNLGWSHLVTIISLSLAPVIFALFIFVETKIATHPFAPGHIILDGSLLACYLGNFFGTGGYTAALFCMPLFFQAIQFYNATESGAYLVPPMVGVVIASVGGGWVVKKTERYYWVTVLGHGLALLSIVPLTMAIWFKSTVGEIFGNLIIGIGVSSATTTTLVGLIANAAPEDMAMAIACSYLFRSLGSSIALSLSSATLQQVLRMQLAARFPDGEEAREIERKVRESLEYIKQLPPWQAEQVTESYQMAILGAHAPVLILVAFGFFISFWIKERPLKK